MSAIVTWTFVLAYMGGANADVAITVPNFRSLESCQAYGKTVYQRVPRTSTPTLYECVPSK